MDFVNLVLLAVYFYDQYLQIEDASAPAGSYKSQFIWNEHTRLEYLIDTLQNGEELYPYHERLINKVCEYALIYLEEHGTGNENKIEHDYYLRMSKIIFNFYMERDMDV